MTQMLDLLPRYQEAIQSVLDQHVPEAEVWAFGSRVAGTSHEGSDLDLVLRNPGDLSAPFSNLELLRETLTQSTIPILVEVYDWDRLPDSFRAEIEKKTCYFALPSDMQSRLKVEVGDKCSVRSRHAWAARSDTGGVVNLWLLRPPRLQYLGEAASMRSCSPCPFPPVPWKPNFPILPTASAT